MCMRHLGGTSYIRVIVPEICSIFKVSQYLFAKKTAHRAKYGLVFENAESQ